MSRTVLLGDIVRVRRGSSPRPIQDFIQDKPGIPWVKIADATAANSRFITQTKEYIKEAGRKHSVSVTPETLIMSNSATPGLPMIMKLDASVHDGWLVIDELKDVDRDWLYYYLLDRRAQSAREASGSVFSNLKTDIVRSFKVNLPDIGTQKKVAQILWDIDEKIELNRKMNEALEKMGLGLFRHYFIDNPEADKWKVGKVGDILSVLESGTRPKGGAVDSGIPSIGAENIDGLGQYYFSKEKFVSVEFFDKANRGKIQSEDVLLYKDGAYVGKKTLFMDGFPHEKCMVNEHVFILRTNSRLKSQFYLYFWLDQQNITDQIISNGIKAAQPGLNQTGVNSLPVLIPESTILQQFDEEIRPIMEAIYSNAKQNHNLAILRDTLLPRLINGKVKI